MPETIVYRSGSLPAQRGSSKAWQSNLGTGSRRIGSPRRSPDLYEATDIIVVPATGTIAELRAEVRELRDRVKFLEDALEIVDEPDRDEAIERARRFFGEHPARKIYPDDLATAIGTSVSLAVDICEELTKEGAIGPAG